MEKSVQNFFMLQCDEDLQVPEEEVVLELVGFSGDASVCVLPVGWVSAALG